MNQLSRSSAETNADWRGARVLVVGGSGFVGRYLMPALSKAGAEVSSLDVSRKPVQDIRSIHADLLDPGAMKSALSVLKPSHVFHLAGRLKADPRDPGAMERIHVDGTRLLFETLHAVGLNPVVFIASSAAVYGAPSLLPVSEDAPLSASAPYGKTKIAQEKIAFDAMHELGVPVICARSFNLLGPGLSPGLIASQVARSVALAERGGERVVRLGDLSRRRDFLDIRDAVRAFLSLMAKPAATVVNVCSGFSVPVRDCVDRLLTQARVPMKIETDAARLASVDAADVYGSTARLASIMPWTDLIPLERSLGDLLEDWRRRLACGEE